MSDSTSFRTQRGGTVLSGDDRLRAIIILRMLNVYIDSPPPLFLVTSFSMNLTLHNTLTGRKEPFISIHPRRVVMYCCGVTVYDHCHLGHARSYMVWDVLRRYLQWCGYTVHYVQNFTDIDDKILHRASVEGVTMQEVSDRYIAAYFQDIRRLNILDADDYPRVTEHIPAIHQLIEALEQKGYAYAVDGDVYYSVRQFAEYGKLSGRKLEQLQAGGRVAPDAPDQKKRDPFDFALWKAAKPGEPAWESPWGMGRPGWHIECSAMVRDCMGDTIDIHMGGGDLTFPHHENEIAQSEAATRQPLSQYWMPNGMVNVNGEKMSKSLGNFTTIRELLDKYDSMAVRLFILQAQYRKPVDFNDKALTGATNAWLTLQEGLLFGDRYGEKLGFTSDSDLDEDAITKFKDAVDDDFNFAGGLAVLFELAKNLE